MNARCEAHISFAKGVAVSYDLEDQEGWARLTEKEKGKVPIANASFPPAIGPCLFLYCFFPLCGVILWMNESTTSRVVGTLAHLSDEVNVDWNNLSGNGPSLTEVQVNTLAQLAGSKCM